MISNFSWEKSVVQDEEFYAQYTSADGVPCSVVFKKYRDAHIVCPTYEPLTREPKQQVEYMFNLLQLYMPWRQESDIFGEVNGKPYEEVLEYFQKKVEEIDELNVTYQKTLKKQQILEMAKKWQEEAAEEPTDLASFFAAILHYVFKLTSTDANVVDALQKQYIDAAQSTARALKTVEEYEAMMDKNNGQKEIYNFIIQAMQKLRRTKHQPDPEDVDVKPLRIFISGVAGRHMINQISDCLF